MGDKRGDKMTRVVGAPPKYKTPAELQDKINDYFLHGVKQREVVTRDGVSSIPVPTITGLVLHCGFCDRASFYDYEKKAKFSHTIKMARTFIENNYEELLQATGGSGAIFALKNFGWTDQQKDSDGEGLAEALHKIADALPE